MLEPLSILRSEPAFVIDRDPSIGVMGDISFDGIRIKLVE